MQIQTMDKNSMKEKLFSGFSKLRDKISRLNERRNLNSETYKATNLILTLMFPIFMK